MPITTDIDWLWHGLLAPGCIALLTRQWKTGKSTLIALLLAKMQSGQPLADRGLAVLVLHHPKKGDTKEGQAARGIGVLNAEVDIILEMTTISSAGAAGRRRRIVAFSRFEETPRRLLLELNPEGTDYTVLPPHAANPHDETLLDLIRTADRPATAASLRQTWPDEHTRPDLTTIRRWLGTLVEQELIVQTGSGKKNDPFRYEGAKTK